jgi:hypothetical protein
MMSVILPNNLLTMQLPEPRVMIATRRDQIRRIRRERTIPNPSLMARQGTLKIKGPGFRGCLARDGDHGVQIFDLPDLGSVVRAARCQVFDVGRQEHAGYVLGVCFEVGYRH